MKNFFVLISCLCAFFLISCAASKFEIQETSSSLDVLIEVRTMQDTIGLMIGNSLYLNTEQLTRDPMFPLLVSSRDPVNIERITPTITLTTPENLIGFMNRAVKEAKKFGFVIGSNVNEQIGFEEQDAIQKISAILSKVPGASLYLFHEKEGELTDMKKLF